MDYYRNPEVQEAAKEYAEIEWQLLSEVPPPNPVSTGPVGSSNPPEIQHTYPAQRPNIFPVAGLANVPTSIVTVEEVEVTTLRKPYPGAPEPVSQEIQASTGINLGQGGQSKIPQFFTMGTSTSLGLAPPNVKVQKGNKFTPATNLEVNDKSGWYWSEFGGGWYKTGELLEEEQRQKAEKLVSEAS